MFRKREQWRWLSVRNDAATAAPAYAALKVTGYDADSGAVTVDRPDTSDLDPGSLLINGPLAIPAEGFGQATIGDPVLAQVSGVLAPGDSLGTEEDEWHLLAGGVGWVAWSERQDDEDEADPGLAVVMRAGSGEGSDEGEGDCSATCFENIDFASLDGTFVRTGGACTFDEEFDTRKYCGPICVSDTPCAADDCTRCLPFYYAGVPPVSGDGVAGLVGVFDGTLCRKDYTGSPKKYLKGCYNISSVATPGSIPVIDTTQPFYAQQNPDDCDAPWVWVYTLIYISGAFVDVTDPVQYHYTRARRVAVRYANVLPDVAYTPALAIANAAAIQEAADDATAPEVKTPGCRIDSHQVNLDASHSGMTFDFAHAEVVNKLGGSFQERVLIIDAAAKGYTDGISSVTATTFVTGPAASYLPGSVIYLFVFDNPAGVVERHIVASVAGTTVTVTGPIVATGTLTHGKWTRNGRVVVTATTTVLTMASADDAALFAVDGWYMFTDGTGPVGQSFNELHHEWVQVYSITAEVIVLRRPITGTYNSARLALLPGPYAERITLRNLQGCSPTYPYDTIIVKDARDLIIENTDLIAAGELPAHLLFILLVACDSVTLRNFHGGLDTNASRNVLWDGGDSHNMGINEMSRGVTYRGVRIGGFITSNTGASDVLFERCQMLASAGLVFDAGSDDYTFRDCLWGGQYWIVNGARLRVENARGTGTIEVRSQCVDSALTNTGALGFVFKAGSTGRLANVPLGNITNETISGAWRQHLGMLLAGQQTFSVPAPGSSYTAQTESLIEQILAAQVAHGINLPFILAYLPALYAGAAAGDADFQDVAGIVPADAHDEPVGLITTVSANGNSPAQATAGKRPLLKTSGGPNGKPYWAFDGTDDTLAFPGTGGFNVDGSSFSYFAVVKPTDRVTDYALMGAVATGRVWRLQATTGLQHLEHSFTAALASSNTAVPTDRWSLIGVTYNGATGEIRFYLNGQYDGGATVTPVAFQDPAAYLGSRANADLFYKGGMASFAKAAIVLVDPDQGKLEADWNGEYELYSAVTSHNLPTIAALLQLAPRNLAPMLF